MRSNQDPLVRLAAIILVIGLGIGGWRAWWPSEAVSDNNGVNHNDVIVPIVTSQSKAVWIDHQILRFNATHDHVAVSPRFVEARDAMDRVLFAHNKPVIWCPDSPVWVGRANDLWRTSHSANLIDLDDANSFRALAETPVVFLTTREKAKILKPLLGGEFPWTVIGRLTDRSAKIPWGKLKFRQPDPVQSNCGVLTLATIFNEYAQTHGAPGDKPILPNDKGFLMFLSKAEANASFDTGGLASVSAYSANPSTADFIVTYENLAVDAAEHNPSLSVIYPNPTAISQETVCIVDGPWVTKAERDVARDFLAELTDTKASREARLYHMRPAEDLGSKQMDPLLAKLSDQGFQQIYSRITLPSYDVLNDLAFEWRTHYEPNHG